MMILHILYWQNRFTFFSREFQIFSNMGSAPMPPDEDDRLIRFYVEWILLGEPKYVRMGHDQFCEIAVINFDTFKKIANTHFIIDIFTNVIHLNKCEIPILIRNIFSVLAENTDEQLDRGLTNVTQNKLGSFFKNYGVCIKVAANLSKLYRAHPYLLPSSNECHVWSREVITFLSGYRRPNPMTKDFLNDAEEVSRLLPLLWDHSYSRDETIQDGLRNFYALISVRGKVYFELMVGIITKKSCVS